MPVRDLSPGAFTVSRLLASLGLALLSLGLTPLPAQAQTPGFHEGPDITGPDDLASRLARARRGAATRAKLSRRGTFCGIVNPKTKLDDALQLVERSYGLCISINERAFQDEGVTNPLDWPIGKVIPKLFGASPSTVLRRILAGLPSKSGVTLFARGDQVEISTVSAYRYELGLAGGIFLPAPPARRQR
jgi:hypothetical protein